MSSDVDHGGPPADGGGPQAPSGGGAPLPESKPEIFAGRDASKIISKRVGKVSSAFREILKTSIIQYFPWFERAVTLADYFDAALAIASTYGFNYKEGEEDKPSYDNAFFQTALIGLLLWPTCTDDHIEEYERVLHSNTSEVLRLGAQFLYHAILGIPMYLPAVQGGVNFATPFARMFSDYLIEGQGPSHLKEPRYSDGFFSLWHGQAPDPGAPSSPELWISKKNDQGYEPPPIGEPRNKVKSPNFSRKEAIDTILRHYAWAVETRPGSSWDPSNAEIRDPLKVERKQAKKERDADPEIGRVMLKRDPKTRCKIATWIGPKFKVDFYPNGKVHRIPDSGLLNRVRWWYRRPALWSVINAPQEVMEVIEIFPQLMKDGMWQEEEYLKLKPSFRQKLELAAHPDEAKKADDSDDGWSPEMINSMNGISNVQNLPARAATLLATIDRLVEYDKELHKRLKETKQQKKLAAKLQPETPEQIEDQATAEYTAQQKDEWKETIEPNNDEEPRIIMASTTAQEALEMPEITQIAVPEGCVGSLTTPALAVLALPASNRALLYGKPARIAVFIDPAIKDRPLERNPNLDYDGQLIIDQWGNGATMDNKYFINAYVRKALPTERDPRLFNMPIPNGWIIPASPTNILRAMKVTRQLVRTPPVSTKYYTTYGTEDIYWQSRPFVTTSSPLTVDLQSIPFQSFAQLVPCGNSFCIDLTKPMNIRPEQTTIKFPTQYLEPTIVRNTPSHPTELDGSSSVASQDLEYGHASTYVAPTSRVWYHLSNKRRGQGSTTAEVQEFLDTVESPPNLADAKLPSWTSADTIIPILSESRVYDNWDQFSITLRTLSETVGIPVKLLNVQSRCTSPFRLAADHRRYMIEGSPATRTVKQILCYPIINESQAQALSVKWDLADAQPRSPSIVLEYGVSACSGPMFKYGDDIERPPSPDNPYNLIVSNTYNVVDPFEPVGYAEYLNRAQLTYKPKCDQSLIWDLLESTTSAQFAFYRTKAATGYYSYGTVQGQCCRFIGCVQNGSFVSGNYEVLTPFEPTCYYNNQAYLLNNYSRLMGNVDIPRQPNNSNLGPTLPNLLRTPATVPLERNISIRWARDLFGRRGCVEDADRKKGLEKMLFTFLAKPKLECLDRAKYWTKSRTIFSTNQFAMEPFQICQAGIKPEYSSTNTLLLGCDPPSAFWEVWKQQGWRVYSDNVYYFSPTEWGDFDGSSMESVIDRPIFHSLCQTIYESAKQKELYIQTAIKQSELASIKAAINGFLDAETKTFKSVTAPSFPTTHSLKGKIFSLPADLPSLMQCLSGLKVEAMTVQTDCIRIQLADTLGDKDNFLKRYLDLFEQIPERAVGVNTHATFSIPFMPSGIPCTALLNSIVSYNSLLKKGKPAKHPFNKAPPGYQFRTLSEYCNCIVAQHFCRSSSTVKRGLGAVMTIEGRGLWSDQSTHENPKSPDFLGLIHYTEPFSHLELRQSTLLAAVYYQDVPGPDEPIEDLTLKRLSGLIAWILNGGVFWDGLFEAVCKRIAQLGYTSYADIFNSEPETVLAEDLDSLVPPDLKESDYILRAIQQSYYRLVDPEERPKQIDWLKQKLSIARTILSQAKDILVLYEQLIKNPDPKLLQAIINDNPKYADQLAEFIKHNSDPSMKVLAQALPDKYQAAKRSRVPKGSAVFP